MITKHEIESAIISALDSVPGIVAKKELEEDYLSASKNTVFVKVKSYQFPYDLTLENIDINSNQLSIINIQIRIVYRSVKNSNNLSEFEDKVINKLTGLHLDITDYVGNDLILTPFQINETTNISQDLRQSLNIFRLTTNIDFSI